MVDTAFVDDTTDSAFRIGLFQYTMHVVWMVAHIHFDFLPSVVTTKNRYKSFVECMMQYFIAIMNVNP